MTVPLFVKLSARIRKLCWKLGAFTTCDICDTNITHVLVPDNAQAPIELPSRDLTGVFVVYTAWLEACTNADTRADESQFSALCSVSASLAICDSDSRQPRRRELTACSTLVHRPSGDSNSTAISCISARASVARRRSDVSSVPLRPDGIFRDLTLSLFGWNDARMEASLTYQLTSNGARIGNLVDASLFACVCADGTKPTTANARLVSQRWVNDCLASGNLITPEAKITYVPSASQLPLLVVSKVCLYITEKDQAKFDEISEIAKLCGFKFVSRAESRTPISAVTHFIFHDLLSVNRRRDLIPLARKNGKHIVSLDWLKDTYCLGQVQDESKYDLSTSLEAPALTSHPSSPSEQNSILKEVRVRVSSSCSTDVGPLIEKMGATIEPDPHVCGEPICIGTALTCSCETVKEDWIRECLNQRRQVPRDSYVISPDENLDKIMIENDPPPAVKWESKPAARIKTKKS